MDWSNVKTALVTVAPWIAATLGSPVAGIAVKVLCDTFGLSGSSATPENVISALAGASPAQLQTLRDAESKHIETMTQLGYAHIETLAQAQVSDLASARDLGKADIAGGNAFTGALAAIVRPLWGIGAFCLVAYHAIAHIPIDAGLKDIVELVIQFYFGGRVIEKITPHIAGLVIGDKSK